MSKFIAKVWKGKKRHQVTVCANSISGAEDKKKVRDLFSKHRHTTGWSNNIYKKK